MILPEETPGPLIAHRGASLDAPENTLEAYRLAAEVGFSWIEVDTQLTRDGVAVMMHDKKIDRTTNGTGFLCNQNYAALSMLDAAPNHPDYAGTKVPTLVDTIKLCGETSLGLILEIKPLQGLDIINGHAVAGILNEHWPRKSMRIVVTSFSASCLQAVRQHCDWVPVGLATEAVPDKPQDYIKALKTGTFHLNYQFALQYGVDKLLDTGAHVAVATVNKADDVVSLLQMGIHGVMTDRSDLFGCLNCQT